MVVARLGIIYETQNMNSTTLLPGIRARARTQAMTTATGRPKNTVIPQIMKVFPMARKIPGWVKATRQLSRLHSGVPTNGWRAALNEKMNTSKMG